MWDVRKPNPLVVSIALAHKVFAMDLVGDYLVVAGSERWIGQFNLGQDFQKPFREGQGPLTFQSRSLACFPSGDGYALTSIEGRCAVQYAHEDPR
jgi:mRNA export factor